jgi:hypothetical protein
VALAVMGCWMASVAWRTAPQRIGDRSEVSSPYRNTRPGVAYLGDAACVRCHAEIAETYRHHPMGRSLAPIAEAPAIGDDSGERPVFAAEGLEYSIEHRDGRVFHQETRRDAQGRIVTRGEAEVRYVLGSGRRGIGYLVERDGFLFQSPINWYSQEHRWYLAPGYEVQNYHFDRPIRPGCLFCHANRVEPVVGTLNRYRPPTFHGHAIGCERCHGPGALHVRSPEVADGRDLTIVNPARLEPSLREAVCEQCHLLGDHRVERLGRRQEDYRPGLPLPRFWTVLVQPRDSAENRFVGQVEQMHESRCFRASRGRLGCISCHDPHELPAPRERVAYFRDRCLECHAQNGCSLPAIERRERGRDEDCIGCHMPRAGSSSILHVATTNHRIPRQGDRASPSPPSPAERPRPGWRRLVNFHQELLDPGERNETGRAIGITLCRDGADGARRALPMLEAALAVRSDDVPAWEAKGHALGWLGRGLEGLDAFRKALAQEPDRESALVGAAYLAVQLDRRQDAAAFWRRAITISPRRSDYHAELALVSLHDRQWRDSADACRETLRLNPSWVEVRKWLVQCLLQLGDTAAARRELAIVLGFDPPDRDELLRTFTLEAPSGTMAP